jgi:rubredoxin-NAD+ reductase
VHAVNDLLDYARWRAAIAEGDVSRRVLMIGAGLIGCEFCNDLGNAGIATEVVDPLGWCLPTLLPRGAGARVAAARWRALGAKLPLRHRGERDRTCARVARRHRRHAG